MGTGAVFELGCNRETKMGVRASGISNQKTIGIHLIGIAGIPNTPEYGSMHSPMHGSIHEDTIPAVVIISFFAFFTSSTSSTSSKPFKNILVFETPPATTTLTTNDHCNRNKAIVSRRHRITTLPVTHRHGPDIRHNIRPNLHRSSDRCVADLHLYGTLEAK